MSAGWAIKSIVKCEMSREGKHTEVLSSGSHSPLINDCEVAVLQAKETLRKSEVLLTTDERSMFTILLSSRSTGWRPATLIWAEEVLYTNPSSQSPLGAEQKSVNKSCCQSKVICRDHSRFLGHGCVSLN